MKRMIGIMGVLTLITSTSINIVDYYLISNNRINYVSMLNSNYWKITSNRNYYGFVKHYETEISKPASIKSKNEFDALSNKRDANTGWKDYASLQSDLTSKKLSASVTANINWTSMFQQVNLNNKTIVQAQTALLTFYNIIANLYQKNNVLRLLQSIKFEPNRSDIFGYIHFISGYNYYRFKSYNSQIMGLSPIFANQSVINMSYNYGYAATNALISTPVHEYGHALSNFLSVAVQERLNFNDELWPITNNRQSKQLLNDANNRLTTSEVIPNRAKLLMDYLDTEANIGSDPIKKLFFPLIVVRSNYGRSYWLEENQKVAIQDEFFAEAFDEWIDTPSNERNWNWELLNNFFMHKLPTFL